jgi:hypothetical protein
MFSRSEQGFRNHDEGRIPLLFLFRSCTVMLSSLDLFNMYFAREQRFSVPSRSYNEVMSWCDRQRLTLICVFVRGW